MKTFGIFIFMMIMFGFTSLYADEKYKLPLNYEDQIVNSDAKNDSLFYYKKYPYKAPSRYESHRKDFWSGDENWIVRRELLEPKHCFLHHKKYNLYVTSNGLELRVYVPKGTYNENFQKYAFLHKDLTVGILLTAGITIGHNGDQYIFYGVKFDPSARQTYFQEYAYLQLNEHVIDLTGSKAAWAKLKECEMNK